MIDVDRLVALRSRFSELHADYQRRGAELRDAAGQLARDRASLLATHPEVAQRIDTMTADELKAAGVSVRAVVAMRATAIAIERKRTAHEHLGARIRVWAAYMMNVERLAAEYQ